MISNQLTLKVLSNNEQRALDSGKFQKGKIVSISTNTKCDDNITSASTTIDDLNPSTLISWDLFSRSKPIDNHQAKSLINSHNSHLILTQQNLSHPLHRSTSDYIDWTNHDTNTSSAAKINNQLDAIHFLQEYLQNGNSNVLIDLLHEIAEEINIDHNKQHYSHSAINNNHFHLTPTFNSNLQLSNNKEKKNKKEKSDDKGQKDEKKKENGDEEIISKKTKKRKEKSKKIEESTTTTTDSEVVADSPVIINPTRMNLKNPKPPAETTGFPTLSVPIPHPGGPSTSGFISPNTVAHLSQVQHQLQTDSQDPSLNKTAHPLNMSVQQQLQSLSQMARDGDEILVTLSVNALTQKQHKSNNNNMQNYQQAFQNNPCSPQLWNQMVPPPPAKSTRIMMPRNLEIVAKGFARIQNEHPQPPTYPQQPMMYAYNQSPYGIVHPPFVPRYPNPCHSSSGPPQVPIGPPIQPMFVPPNMTMSGVSARPPASTAFTPGIRANVDDPRNRSHIKSSNCDYLCQSSIYQPDFRGRPSPGLMINPYFSNSNSPSSMNYSAKRSPKPKHKSSRKNQQHGVFFDNINRTYSSIY